MPTLIDSYGSANYEDGSFGFTGGVTAIGQSFTGDGKQVTSARAYLARFGTPTYPMRAKIYAHSGTYGTDSVATGSALGTSADVNSSSVNATTPGWLTFTFTGGPVVANGTKYCLVVEADDDGSGNSVGWANDYSSPAHGGNGMYFIGGSWSAYSSDFIFEAYGDPPSTAPQSRRYTQAVRRASSF